MGAIKEVREPREGGRPLEALQGVRPASQKRAHLDEGPLKSVPAFMFQRCKEEPKVSSTAEQHKYGAKARDERRRKEWCRRHGF